MALKTLAVEVNQRGDAAAELREQLRDVPTQQAMFRILEQGLLARMEQSVIRHPAVAYAVQESRHLPDDRSIAELAEHAGLGARQLTQVFCDEVGMPPKRFFRMPAALHLYVADADAVYQRALAAGATSLMGPSESGDGDRRSGVQDRFGKQWYIATHLQAL